MRKKVLKEQNALLFSKLEDAKREISELKTELGNTKNALSAAQIQVELLSKNTPVTVNDQTVNTETTTEENSEAFNKMREHIENAASISEDSKYGSKAIGNIVLAAAEHCTKLGSDLKNRELVNLILGKSEVSKSEILGVVSLNDSLDSKKIKIDKIEKDTKDYFESVMAQEI